MKKLGFLEGAIINIIAVIICKILGLIYVIPFYAVVGSQGGALYSYAYSIYTTFVSLASIGIPTAMSKIISEYDALGFNYTKEKAYKMSSRILIILGIIVFLILFIFAKEIAFMIKGNIEGGNTLEDVTLVIRVISTAILIVPLVGIRQGYLEGHKHMVVSNVALVLEQLVRVLVIVLGSFVTYKVLKLPLKVAISIAVFGATLGALVSYIYMEYKIKSNKSQSSLKIKDEEKKYTNKIILKKIILYAMPFVLISLLRSITGSIDTFTVVKTLVSLGYDVNIAESVYGIITTWGAKLNMIITSLVVGLSCSLVPNIMGSYVTKNYKDVNYKINQSLQVLLISVIPMTIGLSFLSFPVWTIFYGYDVLGANFFSYFVFTSLTLTFNTILVDATQTINNTKASIGSLLAVAIIKFTLNIPLMYLFNKLGIQAYYGPIFATMISHIVAIIILMLNFKKKTNISYISSIKIAIKVLIASLMMLLCLCTLKLFIPITYTSRIISLLICILYALVGMIVYIYIVYKFNIINEIIGNDSVKRYINKFIKKK